MDEDDLQVFINGVIHYFDQCSDTPAEVGTPYLMKDPSKVPMDYTGIIGVSGRRKGSVYFTAPTAVMEQLLVSLGESEVSHDNCCDLVGEVTNTISGNARRDFGKDFMISVPVVVVGSVGSIKMPEQLRSFVIPVTWCGQDSHLVICLE